MDIYIIIIILGMALFLVILFLYVKIKAKERKNVYERILKSKEKLLSQGRWFQVRYCSEERSLKFKKIFPWEAAGILYLSKDKVMFFGEGFSRENLEIEFYIKNSYLKWMGRIFLNGATSWLAITFQGERHYFSSETGTLVFGSESATRQIYNELDDVFGSGNIA